MISCDEIGKPAGIVSAGKKDWSSRAVIPPVEKLGLESAITEPAKPKCEVDPFLIEAVTEKLLQNPENIPPALMGAAIRHMLNLDVNQREVEIQMALGAVDPKYKLAVGLFLEAAIEVWAERQGFVLVKTAEYDAQKSEVFSVLQDERGKGLFRRLIDASFNHDSVLAEKMLQATRRLSLEKKELDKQIRDALMRLSAITEKTDATVERANRLHELAAERSEEASKHASESRAKIQLELGIANSEAKKIRAEAQIQAEATINKANLTAEQSQQKLLTSDTEFNKYLIQTKEQAAIIIRKAQVDASSIGKRAEEKADSIYREAEIKSSAIVTRAQESAAKHEVESTFSLRHKEEKLRVKIASLEVQIEELSKQHPDLNNKFDLGELEYLARANFVSAFSNSGHHDLEFCEGVLINRLQENLKALALEFGDTTLGSNFCRVSHLYITILQSMIIQSSLLCSSVDYERQALARISQLHDLLSKVSDWINMGSYNSEEEIRLLKFGYYPEYV